MFRTYAVWCARKSKAKNRKRCYVLRLLFVDRVIWENTLVAHMACERRRSKRFFRLTDKTYIYIYTGFPRLCVFIFLPQSFLPSTCLAHRVIGRRPIRRPLIVRTR